MKTFLFSFILLCGTAAFAQQGSTIPEYAQPWRMYGNVEHASQHAMATENNLLGSSAYSWAKGEVPLAELGSIEYEIPLGDVARAYRAERAASKAPKAAKVLEK